MAKELVTRGSVQIKAPAAKVWEALTTPEWTRQYMFGCDIVSGLSIGDPILWKGMLDGNEVVFVKGTIVENKTGSLLRYTTFDPNMGIADVPSNYLTVTYELSHHDGQTTLKLSQGDFAKVEQGEKRFNDAGEGWNPLLTKIKELVEKSVVG